MVQRGRPKGGQVPERGVVEVNGAGDDAWLTAESNQVTRYWGRYKSPKWAPPATPVRKPDHEPVESFAFRHLWGQAKPAELIATAEVEPDGLYFEVEPLLPLGLPFVETAVSPDWFDRPALPDLFPVSFPGVKTSRDGFLVDTDLDRLRARVGEYFDPALRPEEIARRYPRVMKSTARFDAPAVRDVLLKRGGPDESGFAYRPFDIRWLYWEEGYEAARREAGRLQAPRVRGQSVARSPRARGRGGVLRRILGRRPRGQLRKRTVELVSVVAA
ncbi:MAG: hypothetical protein OXN97_21000 [Bryobacterales bacterium]|nr:hypothetical protein [Bryobacterales bacterium]